MAPGGRDEFMETFLLLGTLLRNEMNCWKGKHHASIRTDPSPTGATGNQRRPSSAAR
jgi:hypothetical protein